MAFSAKIEALCAVRFVKSDANVAVSDSYEPTLLRCIARASLS